MPDLAYSRHVYLATERPCQGVDWTHERVDRRIYDPGMSWESWGLCPPGILSTAFTATAGIWRKPVPNMRLFRPASIIFGWHEADLCSIFDAYLPPPHLDVELLNFRSHILMYRPRYGSACTALPIDDPPILHRPPTDNLLQGIVGHTATLHRVT
jgi:hypothetical protein